MDPWASSRRHCTPRVAAPLSVGCSACSQYVPRFSIHTREATPESNTGEDMAIRCRTMARTMPLNSKEQREMLLKASFYKQCGTEVSIDPITGVMSGPPEALRNAFIWYRDRAKMNLTPEQEEFLREEA